MSPGRRMLEWRGRSGRGYSLSSEGLDRLLNETGRLYLVAKGSLVLWVGTSADLVADPASRARLRLALESADRCFRLETSLDEVEMATIVWDLEGAEPVGAQNAA